MTPVLLAGEAYITNYTNKAATRNKDTKAMPPDMIQFIMELLIARNGTKLSLVPGIFFQGPVRGRGYCEVYGFVGNPLDFAGVAAAENLICFLDSKRGVLHLWNHRVSEWLFQSKAITRKVCTRRT